MNAPLQPQGVHLMAKPIGPLCNLDCDYCFYLEKEQLYPRREKFRMSDEVLRAYVDGYIAAQPTPEVEFTWQGGEPMLMGLEFFERAVAYQQASKALRAGHKTIRNTLQTNGTLLDEAWCAFLARHDFTVGISIDGPRELHDLHRPDKQGRSSFDAVMRGLTLLQKHKVKTNVLVTVTRDSAPHGLAVYRFLRDAGVRYIQFNPVVERAPAAEQPIRLHFARPPNLAEPKSPAPPAAASTLVTPQTVERGAYGDFLIAVFDEWVRNDVGTVHVMNFEWALASWLQLPASVCLFAPRCGKALIVEHDGGVYSCDHYMYPEYQLGNIDGGNLREMAASPAQLAFGAVKETTLPAHCRRCPYLFACHGECPKNRFMTSPDGESGMNYLCPSYEKYFRHITPAMNALAKVMAAGFPASSVMQAFNGPLILKTAG